MRRLLILMLLIAAGAAAVAAAVGSRAPQRPAQPTGAGPTASAIFAGGCFWCTESDFDHMPGVLATVSGYAGGRTANPTYEQVSAGGTGHIESVRVAYDPRRISYARLVERFFRTIDPLDSGGQFCDRGDQYRSAIFVADREQRRIVEAVKARVERTLGRRVATLILPARNFYPAETYHQDYYRKNPLRYRFYRWNCGRDQRIQALWQAER